MIEIRKNVNLVYHDPIFPILFSQCDLTAGGASQANIVDIRDKKKQNWFSVGKNYKVLIPYFTYLSIDFVSGCSPAFPAFYSPGPIEEEPLSSPWKSPQARDHQC